jgi:cellobiose-specific phosphotransferase system component IIA
MKGKKERNMSKNFADWPKSWDISKWCDTKDPVCRQVVYKARQEHLRSFSNAQIEEFISKLDNHMAQGLTQIQADYFVGEIDGKAYFDEPDSVDLLIHLQDKYTFWGKDIPLQHIKAFLHLLCLSESKKGNFGLAVKAFMVSTHTDARKALADWNNRQQKLNKARDEQNKIIQKDREPRNKKICNSALTRLKNGDERSEIVNALHKVHSLSTRQIRNILNNKCPGWNK